MGDNYGFSGRQLRILPLLADTRTVLAGGVHEWTPGATGLKTHEGLSNSVRRAAFVQLFKSGQTGVHAAGYRRAMSIARDDGAERRTRVDRMIEEFRKAQSRRLARAVTVNGGNQGVVLQRDVHAQAATAGSTTTLRTSH